MSDLSGQNGFNLVDLRPIMGYPDRYPALCPDYGRIMAGFWQLLELLDVIIDRKESKYDKMDYSSSSRRGLGFHISCHG
tara:strand:- start:1112 stop:1348 length:237 start_codon:yes stop_codon:yes gene_type:complete